MELSESDESVLPQMVDDEWPAELVLPDSDRTEVVGPILPPNDDSQDGSDADGDHSCRDVHDDMMVDGQPQAEACN